MCILIHNQTQKYIMNTYNDPRLKHHGSISWILYAPWSIMCSWIRQSLCWWTEQSLCWWMGRILCWWTRRNLCWWTSIALGIGTMIQLFVWNLLFYNAPPVFKISLNGGTLISSSPCIIIEFQNTTP